MPVLVQINDVCKHFVKGDETITPLDGVCLEIEQGEFISLMGASGCGKSTLLNLVAGIDQPTSGTVIVSGTDIGSLSRSQLARWRAENIGYVFQSHNLIPVLTAYENIELPLLLLPLGREQRRERVGIALEAVGLVDRANHYPRQMSGGQCQRAGIGRAIVTDPRLVVADEPTGDLDRESTEQILHLLKQLNEQLGTTLLMVTHDLEAATVADRQLRMVDGVLIEESQAMGHQSGVT